MYKSLFLFAILTVGNSGLAQEEMGWREWFSQKIKSVSKFIIENELEIPVHGNYCGPSYGDQSYQEMPIDGIDMACMRHDYCFDPKKGGTYLSCGCDYQMVVDLDEAILEIDDLTYESVMGLGIAKYFSSSDCYCKKKNGVVKFLKSPTLFEKSQCEL